MKSYLALEEIKESYFSGNEEKAFETLKQNIPKISQALQQDIRTMFNSDLKIDDVIIYFDDPDFRQSATAYIVKGHLLNDEQYMLRIECLVDLDRVLIKPKSEPTNENLIAMHQKILSNCGPEGLCDLKKLN